MPINIREGDIGPEIETVTITVYFVGNNPQHAIAGTPWDVWKDAEEFRKEMNYGHVYVTEAVIHVDTLEVSE